MESNEMPVTEYGYDGVPLGAIVSQLIDLSECEDVDYTVAHGECRKAIAAHFDQARQRVLVAFGLDEQTFREALVERLGETRLAFDYGRLV